MGTSKKTLPAGEGVDAGDVANIPLFDTMIQKLPKEYKDEITGTDKYLKALRPLKFKRTIDRKAGKITYIASDYGISHIFRISGEKLTQNFQWYIVCNGKPETWHRRADYMEETLAYAAKSDAALSARIYGALKGCLGADSCYGERCLARTPYSFDGQKQLTCHGSVELGMSLEDFRDAKEFFGYLNKLIEEKINNGEQPQEKIIVCKTKRSL